MSKLIFLVATIALIGTFAAISFTSTPSRNLQSEAHLEELFEHWKLSFGKMYASAEEEAHKFAMFKDNYMFVMNWNADPSQTSSVGLNEFADLNTAEFGALKGCLMPQPTLMESSEETTERVLNTNANPTSWDWRAKGAVTPIKNQQQCGSCWAFSTTGTLEGLNFINNANLLSFSEQQLVDCSGQYGNEGCDGGWPFWALEYTAANGIELESVYPYTAQDGTCAYNKANVVFTNQGYANVTSKNEASLETSVVQQPTSVCVEADQSVF